MLYKLTKGNISRIRYDVDGVNELLEKGYTLDGEVNKKFEVIDPAPSLKDYSQMSAKELHELCEDEGIEHKGKTKAQILEMLK